MRGRARVALVAAVGVAATTLALAGCSEGMGGPTGSGEVSISDDGVTQAYLLVEGGADRLEISADADDGTLVDVAGTDTNKPPSSESIDVDADVDEALAVRADGGTIEVHVSPTSSWTIEIEAGTETFVADFTDATLDRLAIKNGSSDGTIRLSTPDAVVPIEQTAGFSSLTLEVESGTPVRWTTSAGAGEIDFLGDVTEGAEAGLELTSDAFDESQPYVDLRSSAGLGKLTVSDE
ncbi:hypothetical protein SAMN04489860_2690 [Paraoerskovia marina]|uniref:Adhesin n=1 Tax=Paraoerskovia marina TaxID=545619 RepID=A0A1H1W413_9CELL|nr:hypothetical protein [Paraoerskovia marina]SDS91246.1 hypothetical protein SAMN04489860_2690 [Paraoerskovia marina]